MCFICVCQPFRQFCAQVTSLHIISHTHLPFFYAHILLHSLLQSHIYNKDQHFENHYKPQRISPSDNGSHGFRNNKQIQTISQRIHASRLCIALYVFHCSLINILLEYNILYVLQSKNIFFNVFRKNYDKVYTNIT